MTGGHILSDSESAFKGFLACPISQHLRGDLLELPPEYERFIRRIYAAVRSDCDEVFLALEREGWGRSLMPGEICTPLDFAEMKRCDVVVAYPGASCGVAVELGWASALGKPLILLLDPAATYSPIIRELGHVSRRPVYILDAALTPDAPDPELLRSLSALLRQIRNAWRARYASAPALETRITGV